MENLFSILAEAHKKVPALRFAYGVVGIAAAIMLIQSFGLGLGKAFLAILVMLFLMTLLAVFASIAKPATEPGEINKPTTLAGYVLMWFFVGLTIVMGLTAVSVVLVKQPSHLYTMWMDYLGRTTDMSGDGAVNENTPVTIEELNKK